MNSSLGEKRSILGEKCSSLDEISIQGENRGAGKKVVQMKIVE